MTDRREFIEREILSTLGEFADDFDVDGICDEVSEFDPVAGYVWKDEYAGPGEGAYWDVVQRFDRKEWH